VSSSRLQATPRRLWKPCPLRRKRHHPVMDFGDRSRRTPRGQHRVHRLDLWPSLLNETAALKGQMQLEPDEWVKQARSATACPWWRWRPGMNVMNGRRYAWPTGRTEHVLPSTHPQGISNGVGVYEIWADDACRYIGSADDVGARIRQHSSGDTHQLRSDYPSWTVKVTWLGQLEEASRIEIARIRSAPPTVRNRSTTQRPVDTETYLDLRDPVTVSLVVDLVKEMWPAESVRLVPLQGGHWGVEVDDGFESRIVAEAPEGAWALVTALHAVERKWPPVGERW
jgi:hypothetical protein